MILAALIIGLVLGALLATRLALRERLRLLAIIDIQREALRRHACSPNGAVATAEEEP